MQGQDGFGGIGTFTKEVVFTKDSALSGKWNAYFLLRRRQILVDGTLEQE